MNAPKRLGLRRLAPAVVCMAIAAHVHAFEQIQKLTAFDANGADNFGNAVAISGNVAIIGVDLDSVHGSSSGSAYIYRESADGTWRHEYKLVPADGEAGEVFGHDVGISGDRAIVGAFFDDDRGQFAGSAYIFQDNGMGRWEQVAKLFGDDTAEIDHFGFSVAISGNHAIVGANLAELPEQGDGDYGLAYVFRDDGAGNWPQVAKLQSSDARSRDFFGIDVAIDGNTAVVGANFDDEGGTIRARHLCFAQAPTATGGRSPS
jgi:hypothetical protein